MKVRIRRAMRKPWQTTAIPVAAVTFDAAALASASAEPRGTIELQTVSMEVEEP